MGKWAEKWRKSNKKGTVKRTEDFEITKKSTYQINTFVLAVKSCFPISKNGFKCTTTNYLLLNYLFTPFHHTYIHIMYLS